MRKFSFVLYLVFFLLVVLACSASKPIQKNELQNTNTKDQVQNIEANTLNEETTPPVYKDLDVSHTLFLQVLGQRDSTNQEVTLILLEEAQKADPTSAYLYFLLASKYAELGDFTKALKIAEEGKGISKNLKTSYISLLASLYMRNKKIDSAKVYFKKAMSADERDFMILYEYSMLLESIQKYDELIKVYDVLLPQVNYVKSILDKQIQLLTNSRQDSALIDLLEKAYEIHGDTKYANLRGELLLQNKRYKEALEQVDQVLKQDSKDSTAILIKARVYILQGSLEKSLNYLKTAYFDLKVPSVKILNFIALIELDLKQIDSAKVHLKKLTKHKNYAASAHADLSSIAQTEKDTSTAISEIEKAAKLDPENYLPNQAFVYYIYGRHQKAYDIYDSLLGYWSDWKPSVEITKKVKSSTALAQMRMNANRKYQVIQTMYASALMHQAYYLEKKKKDSVSIYTAKEARKKAASFLENLRLSDSNNVSILFDMAVNYERMELIDKAVIFFNKLLDIDPKHHQALNYLGYMLVDLNRNSKEVQIGDRYIDSALYYKPKEQAYLDSKAWALYRLGKYPEALKIMENLLFSGEYHIDDVVYWEHYMAIAKKMGLKEKMSLIHKKIEEFNAKNLNLIEKP